MFFGGSDEDDGSAFSVGMPTQQRSGSKLSSLFGGVPSDSGNESLMYQSYKQPTKQKQEAPKPTASESPSLLYATTCHAFQYVNGKYSSQGKLGAAVLGHLETKDYKILLYGPQKKPVTNAKIHQEFKLNLQKNNYATFYDDQSQSWSVCFDNENNLSEFSKWVALSRFNALPGSLTTQDINFMEGQEIQKGDTIEMKYTGWLHAGNAFGKVFDSNMSTGKLFKFKVGKGKVIKGWDNGVLGMKKGSKRLLVIPPSLAYGAKAVGDRVPPNSTLIFEVELTRVKYVTPQQEPDNVSLMSVDFSMSSKKDSTPKEPENPPTNNDEADEMDENISKRTKSISEQLSKTPDTKSKLLERMSKMGQAMIPSPSRTTSQEDDHHEDTTQQVRHNENDMPPPESASRPNLKPKPSENRPHVRVDQTQQPPPLSQYQQHQPNPIYSNPLYYQQQQQQPQQQQQQANPVLGLQYQQDQMYMPSQPPPQQQQLALYQSPQTIQNTMFGMPGTLGHMQVQPQPQSNIQQPQASLPNTASSTEINLLMTEGKLHHSELKTDLSRILDKVDSLQAKVVSLETSNQQLALQQAPDMEASIIMQNITRIMKDNEKLNLECAEKGQKIEKLNESITNLLTKNQSFFEKSNQLLVSQSDSMQSNAAQAMAKVSHLEQRNIQLDSELTSIRTQLLLAQKKEEVFENKMAESTVTIDNLQKELRKAKDIIESSDSNSNEYDSLVADLKQQMKTAKKEQKQLKLTVDSTEEELNDTKLEKESLAKSLNDMKKKRKTEKEKFDEELEELKNSHEEELKNLKQRYNKSSNGETEKLNKLEEELTTKFEKETQSKLKVLQSKHKDTVEVVTEERDSLQRKLDETKTKLDSLQKELSEEHKKRLQVELEKAQEIHTLQLDEVNREAQQLKDALRTLENKIAEGVTTEDSQDENLQAQLNQLSSENVKLTSDKNSLETKLGEIEQALSAKDANIDQLKENIDDAFNRGLEEGRATMKTISQASYERGFSEGKQQSDPQKDDNGTSAKPDQSQINESVKKVMNNVFFQLKNEFEPSDDYTGSDVVNTILNVVRDVTLKLTASKDKDEEDEEDDEDEDEDEESELSEDESEEEEEEEEEEENQKTPSKSEEAMETKEKEEESLSGDQDTEPAAHPAEEGTVSSPEPGLDVTGNTAFDEVDVDKKDGVGETSNVSIIAPSTSPDKTEVTDHAISSTVSPPPLSTKVEDEIDDSSENPEAEPSSEPQLDVYETDGKEPEDVGDKDEEVTETPEHDAATDDDDDDNMSFTSATSEPVENTPTVAEKQDDTSSATIVGDDKDDRSTLEKIGIDKSIFGGDDEEDNGNDLFKEPAASKDASSKDEDVKEDESALFFGPSNNDIVDGGDDDDEPKKAGTNTTQPKNTKTKKSSIFDDESDEDDFFNSKDSGKKTSKAASSSMFSSRSPPPLFGDDDDDTNWI